MTEKLAKRAAFLAYKASHVVGMGIFQARDDVTEEKLWESASKQHGRVYIDYGFGRMMKLVIRYDDVGCTGGNTNLTADYESWCIKYPTYAALFDAAEASLRGDVIARAL